MDHEKLLKLANIFASTKHHEFKKVDKLMEFYYENEFAEKLLKKYKSNTKIGKIIKAMLHFGDLRLGMLLKKLEGEDGLYLDWLEQFCKEYSSLGLPPFEDDIEKKFGTKLDRFIEQAVSDDSSSLE